MNLNVFTFGTGSILLYMLIRLIRGQQNFLTVIVQLTSIFDVLGK